MHNQNDDEFQFHYGAIRRHQLNMQLIMALSDFNSNMVQLSMDFLPKKRVELFYFNSRMVQIKVLFRKL